MTHRIPDDHIHVLNCTVPPRKHWQARIGLVLVRILARRVHLVRIVGGHPEMLAHEPGASADIGAGMLEREGVLAGAKLVGDGLAQFVGGVWIDNQPVTAPQRVDELLSLVFSLQ